MGASNSSVCTPESVFNTPAKAISYPDKELKVDSKGAPFVLINWSLLVSGGFAIVQPGSQLSINAVEGYPLEDFNPDVS